MWTHCEISGAASSGGEENTTAGGGSSSGVSLPGTAGTPHPARTWYSKTHLTLSNLTSFNIHHLGNLLFQRYQGGDPKCLVAKNTHMWAKIINTLPELRTPIATKLFSTSWYLTIRSALELQAFPTVSIPWGLPYEPQPLENLGTSRITVSLICGFQVISEGFKRFSTASKYDLTFHTLQHFNMHGFWCLLFHQYKGQPKHCLFGTVLERSALKSYVARSR